LSDIASIAGKPPILTQHVPLIVIGAGPAGLAAATAAASAGVSTMLVDEHPVSSSLMGLDVPYQFGQRMDSAVQNKARMVSRIVETNPQLAAAFELGMDVKLGVYVVGAFVNGPSAQSLPKPMILLADEERSWLVSFDRLVVAAGGRDLGLGFAGWEKPGVMGAQAALALMQRYQAFNGRRLLVIGSGAVGLEVALRAVENGHSVTGIVELDTAVRGPERMRQDLASRGIPFYARHAVKEARGKTEVDEVVLVAVDDDDLPIAGSETTVACDTVVTAIGLVPNVELLDILGCRLTFDAARGGYVPELDADGRSSVPGVYAAGDCTGSSDDKVSNPRIAMAEGRRAGAAAARDLGAAAPQPTDHEPMAAARAAAPGGYWQRWLKAEIAASGWEVNICLCEEVTRRELVELRPPRYLNWGSSQMRARSLETLAADGPVNQDQVKRLTRAGMGTCQGRRCREQIQALLALAGDVDLSAIPLASYRAPLRPLPLNVCWPEEETPRMRDTWTTWFNIPTQWTPHWKAPAGSAAAQDPTAPPSEVLGLGADEKTDAR
jgi:thioredoxin reductase